MSHTPHALIASYIVLIKDECVLLQRRFQTGWMDGFYSLPAGHVEDGETFTDALIREVAEEIGITLSRDTVKVSHIMHRKAENTIEYIDVFYTTVSWEGEPRICEPEKCDDLSWHPLRSLPENTIPYVREALENIQAKEFYSEVGWQSNN